MENFRISIIDTPVFCFLVLNSLIFCTVAIQNSSPYHPTDLILLNSGALKDQTSIDGRNWTADAGQQSKYCPFYSEITNASQQDPSVSQVPYMTARIMRSNLTCSFPVSIGPKFIRLYFYPTTYSGGLDTSTSSFSMTANNYTLVSNFSAHLAVSAMQPPVSNLVKEFIITVWDNQKVIDLTFIPSPNSFAFINGIEITSMPNNLYAKGFDNSLTYVGNDPPFYLDNTTALETVYRLNVGGNYIDSSGDTGMYRKWAQDSDYVLGAVSGVVSISHVNIKYTMSTPAFVAPIMVYSTKRSMGNNPQVNNKYNLTWIFPVDTGFLYLVRLHFCETRPQVVDKLQLVFSIFINNQTAEEQADVIFLSGGNGVPVYKDYVVWFPAAESRSKQDLWLALHPYPSQFTDAILNGLEIFKLNNSGGSLAGPNPDLLVNTPPQPNPELQEKTESKKRTKSSILVAAGVGTGATLFAISVGLFFFFRKGKGKGKYTDIGTSLLPTELCRQFTIAEIKEATRNFKNQIGSGGFGTVYKGYIENKFVPVAIKRLNSTSKQGTREFHTEIEMLSKLRHIHLVSLIGYCADEDEMILVYEFMPHGNLQDHLYKTNNPSLSWKQRLQICIGAAKGLHYLHTGMKHAIIHRDVKSSNILLDQNLVAKVSDFGLSKIGPTSEDQTHVSTVVRGSVGYLDPEYYRRQHLTEKSDLYSFGVVLLEVLSGRPPIISNQAKERVNLVEWTRNCYRKSTVDQIIDPQLIGDITSLSLNKFVEVAESCVREKATERPTMKDVVWSLEFALQLQESAEKNVDAVREKQEELPVLKYKLGFTIDDDDDLFTLSGGPVPDSSSTFSAGENSSNNDSDQIKSGTVFSEIMNAQGR